ncbi:hypothetical protein ACNO65_17860 [Vibrio campbellii]|uniref:hypothetical protein n=1 Tax=Vibrio campbellii TaxID=680 RepID=UPI003AAD5028
MRIFIYLLMLSVLSGCGGSGGGSDSNSPPVEPTPPNKQLQSIEISTEITSLTIGDEVTLTADAIWDDGTKEDISEIGVWEITPVESAEINSNILTAKSMTDSAVLTISYLDKTNSISFSVIEIPEPVSTFPAFEDDAMDNAYGLTTLKIRLNTSNRYEYTALLWGDRFYIISSDEEENAPLNPLYAKAVTYSRSLSCLMDLEFENSEKKVSSVVGGYAFPSNSRCSQESTNSMRFDFVNNSYGRSNKLFYEQEINDFEVKSDGNAEYLTDYPHGGYTIDKRVFFEKDTSNEFTISSLDAGYKLEGIHSTSGCKVEADVTELKNYVFYLKGNTTACHDGADEGNIDGLLHYELNKATLAFSLLGENNQPTKHFAVQLLSN